MLRAIGSVIGTIILIIVLFFVVRWGLDAYRVSTTENVVATVCDTSHEHVFTDQGVLDIHGNTPPLQPGQTYSFYTQKQFPWEYPTVIAAHLADMSGPMGTSSGACGTVPGDGPPPPINQPGYGPPPMDQPGYGPPPPVDQPDYD